MDKRILHIIILAVASLLLLGMVGCQADVVYPDENQPAGTPIEHAPRKMSYTELIAHSDHIVCVDVLEEYREQEHIDEDREIQRGVIRCFAQVRVRDVLKGDLHKNDVFYVQENGSGTADESGDIWGGPATTLCGGYVMEQGNRLVLFLVNSELTTASGKPLYEMTSSLFSKFFYDSDGKYHASISYSEHYADYLKNDVCLDDNEPKTLREFKKMIAETK